MLTLDRFLLVSLTIATILGETTIHLRQERLDIMTNGVGLDGAYDATLDRIKGQSKGRSTLAMAALMWISRSKRPMRVGELCEALAVKIGSRDMECDNIPSEKNIIRLLHGTCHYRFELNYPLGALYPPRIFQQPFGTFRERRVDDGGDLLNVSELRFHQ